MDLGISVHSHTGDRYNTCKTKLSKIEKKRANELANKFKATHCPICLEVCRVSWEALKYESPISNNRTSLLKNLESLYCDVATSSVQNACRSGKRLAQAARSVGTTRNPINHQHPQVILSTTDSKPLTIIIYIRAISIL